MNTDFAGESRSPSGCLAGFSQLLFICVHLCSSVVSTASFKMTHFSFHPGVARWFESRFGSATEPQRLAWPAIQSGRHTLISAPTGSGKTLAAFLAALDHLFREGLEAELPDETQVVYVSPLKALSNDIRKNLQEPLAGIRALLRKTTGREID